MTYEEVTTELRTQESITPGRLAAIRMFLAGEYSFVSGSLEQILMRKPAEWGKLRAATGSDKQADRRWDASPDGQMEMSHRLKMKSIEKLSSAIKTRLEIAAGEARNQY
jgi:hypothetical protein